MAGAGVQAAAKSIGVPAQASRAFRPRLDAKTDGQASRNSRRSHGLEEELQHRTRVERPRLVQRIHDRKPVILAPSDYARWLGEEPDPRGLMRQFPADLMRMWSISTRVNKPENDDPSIIEPIDSATDAA